MIDGISFDSIKERNRYLELKLLLKAGEIKDLEIHKPFELQEGFWDKDGKYIRPITYEADFVYIDAKTGERVIEDVKSEATKKDKVYNIKKKMMMFKGLYIEEI